MGYGCVCMCYLFSVWLELFVGFRLFAFWLVQVLVSGFVGVWM